MAGCPAACERYTEYKRICEQRRQARKWRNEVTEASVDAAVRMRKGKR